MSSLKLVLAEIAGAVRNNAVCRPRARVCSGDRTGRSPTASTAAREHRCVDCLTPCDAGVGKTNHDRHRRPLLNRASSWRTGPGDFVQAETATRRPPVRSRARAEVLFAPPRCSASRTLAARPRAAPPGPLLRRVRRGSRREHAQHRRGSGPGCARRHNWEPVVTGVQTLVVRLVYWLVAVVALLVFMLTVCRPRPRLPAEEARRARHPWCHGAARLRRHRLARGQAPPYFRYFREGHEVLSLFTGDMNFITCARLAHPRPRASRARRRLHGARGPGVRAGHRRLRMLRGSSRPG